MVRSDLLYELSRKYDAPYEQVEIIFSRSYQRLAASARLTQYLEVLAMQRTRHALQEAFAHLVVASRTSKRDEALVGRGEHDLRGVGGRQMVVEL